MNEVFEITDRVTVLRNGKKTFEADTSSTTRDELVRHMVGHAVGERLTSLRLPGAQAASYRVRLEGAASTDDEIELRPGEIVGLGGLVGGGRTRLARRDRRARARRSRHVAHARRRTVQAALAARRDPSRGGLLHRRPQEGRPVLNLSVATNASAASLDGIARHGWLGRAAERSAVTPVLHRLRLVAASLAMPVRGLSGGNQQKVLFGRALLARPRVLVCDEPTRGVDVGAREEIYALVESLAAQGVAVVVISSELKELLGLCHRLLVVRNARVVAEMAADAQEEDIVRVAVGQKDAPATSPSWTSSSNAAADSAF